MLSIPSGNTISVARVAMLLGCVVVALWMITTATLPDIYWLRVFRTGVLFATSLACGALLSRIKNREVQLFLFLLAFALLFSTLLNAPFRVPVLGVTSAYRRHFVESLPLVWGILLLLVVIRMSGILGRLNHEIQWRVSAVKERRQSQEELQLNKRVLDNAEDGVIWATSDGIITYANRAAARFRSADSFDPTTNGLAVFDLEPSLQGTWESICERCQSGESVVFEAFFTSDEGGSVPCEVRAHNVQDDPTNQLISLAIRDIRERKEMEKELQDRLNQVSHLSRINLAGVMVAGIAHELNQPLFAVTNYAFTAATTLDELANQMKSDRHVDQMRHDLDLIGEQALRAGEILNRLRRMVQKQDPVLAPTPVDEIIAESMHLMDLNQSRHKRPHVHIVPAQNIPIVNIDNIQLQQVLLNVVGNAVDAVETMGTDGEVIISVESDADFVEIWVQDNGPGLPGNAESIFEPFFTTKAKGMGVGLAICRSIMQSHGGDLMAENQNDGGARFRIILPRFDKQLVAAE